MGLVTKKTLIESPVVSWEVDQDKLFPHALPVNSYQSALQICLEAVGATSPDTTVVLPITSSSETVSAVLRSGGYPCILDINEDTLQMDASVLSEVLGASKESVVILGFPGGWDIDKSIKEVCDKFGTPTIVDSRLPPSMNNYGPKGTFATVYDFGPLIGGGGLIWPGHDSYRSGMMLLRSGVLGHAAHMSAAQANALKNLNFQKFFENKVETLRQYKELCEETKVKLKFDHFDRYALIEHESARAVISKLELIGVEAAFGCIPLYTHDVLKKRWPEDPLNMYPVAKKMHERIVALPTSKMDYMSIYQIVKAISEVL